MSLLTPAQLAEIMPELTEPQRQVLIDRAEARIAEEIGFRPYLAPPESGENQLIEGVAATEPLAEREITHTFYPKLSGSLVELPVGPITRWSGLEVDGEAVDFDDQSLIEVEAWTLRWTDPSKRFRAGKKIVIQGFIGWTPATLPFSILEAIKQLSSSLAQSSDVASFVTGELKAERLGPFEAEYVTSADPERGLRSQITSIEPLIDPWRLPKVFF